MTDADHALGHRAIVIGGSLAGMLAARAIAPHFDEVVVLERDDLSGPAGAHDFLYPSTEGDRSMLSEEEEEEAAAYRLQLQMAAARDPVVRDLQAAVQHFIEPFARLFEPDVRDRVRAALGGA